MSELQPIKFCSLDDLSKTRAKGIVIGTGLEQRRFILIRSSDGVKCYVNKCPHQGTPLDTFPDRFLDDTGDYLVCSTHGARFNVDDGICVLGPCLGQSLAPCDIFIRDGEVYLVNNTDGRGQFSE